MVRNVQKEIYRIRELLNDESTKSHLDICRILDIPISTFARRMSQIKQQDLEKQDISNQKTQERLQFNSVERLKEAFELTSQINRDIMLSKKEHPRFRISASTIFLQTECYIFNNSNKGIVSLPSVKEFFEIKPLSIEDIKPFSVESDSMDIGSSYDK